MPTVSTRRSTRVFVPKSVPAMASEDEPVALVLRSGKRLLLSKPQEKKVEADGYRSVEWLRLFGSSRDAAEPNTAGRCWREEGGEVKRETEEQEEGADQRSDRWDTPADVSEVGAAAAHEEDGGSSLASVAKKKFKVSYSRKRKRPMSADTASSSVSLDDKKEGREWRYRITYGRLRSKKFFGRSPADAAELPVITDAGVLEGGELFSAETTGNKSIPIDIVDCSRIFADRAGVPESDLWDGLTDHVVLLFLVDSSGGISTLNGFSRFLLSVLTGMRRTKVKLSVFARHLVCKSFIAVFAQHGIHSLPLRDRSELSSTVAIPGAGMCRINGSLFPVPLLTVNSSALPLYFKFLHLNILLSSRFVSRSFPGPVDPGVSSTDLMTNCPAPVLASNVTDNGDNTDHSVGHTKSVAEPVTVVKDPPLVVRIPNGLKVRRNQKKRSSLRSMRGRSSSWKSRKNYIIIPSRNIAKVTSTAGDDPARQLVEGPITVEPVECAIDSLLCTGDADDLSAAALLTGKSKKSSPRNGDNERMKELKATLSDLKQNLDSVSCKASILVIESDRCWREAGAEVMLELGDSRECHLAVKANGSNRFMYKATQDVKSGVTNRHTNALIWSGESSWKLEFPDRMDWCIFRELHKECYTRNTQEPPVKIIPVPGVQEVSDYAETDRSFSRPECYIKAACDEDERALTSAVAEYDMDSGDEEWLQSYNYNPSSGVSISGQFIQLSGDTFEKVIYAFEKASYQNPNAILGLDAAVDLCADLCNKEMVAAVFDYWIQKRKRKRTALVRIFQEFLSKRALAVDTSAKPILRKKRSFKRQGSQSGRGKPSFFLQVSAQQEQYRRIQEAEKEAKKTEADAIKMRSRAQILMENADLLTYRAVVALGLARAIQGQESGPSDTTFSDLI